MDQPEAFGAEREIPLKMAPFTLACAAKGFPFIVASYSGDSIVFLRTAGPPKLVGGAYTETLLLEVLDRFSLFQHQRLCWWQC